MKDLNKLPVAIIGAGPIGLAAAAHLSVRKEPFVVFEAGHTIADSVRSWAHVPMFSPWKFNLDRASLKILSRYDWTKPAQNKIPAGRDLVEQYLDPLSQTTELKPHIHLNSRVVSVSRKRMSKMRNAGRENAPFVLHVIGSEGTKVFFARAVIDASGTWKNPNPAGAGGLDAIGEKETREKIFYGIPDVLGIQKNRYFSKDVAVIGGGHSAINALLELADLKVKAPDMSLVWLLTKARVEEAYGGLDQDELPGRGKVGQQIKALVDTGLVQVHTPFFVDKIQRENDRLIIHGQSTLGEEQVRVDEIITATGLRPDLDILRELRLDIDQTVESPGKLAPLIDPNIHSCGSVEPHGEAILRHPEKDFYIVGMKSYGRAPTFLLATGYEQVRSVVAALVGDWKAAEEVHLDLPETGVCGVPAAVDPNNLAAAAVVDSCCQPAEPACCDQQTRVSKKTIAR